MKPSPTLPRQTVADFRAAALSAGRYDLMAQEYSYPLTIYLGGQATVAADPAQVRQFYRGFHAAMQAQGFERLIARVWAEDLPRQGRFRVWTDWFAEGPGRVRAPVAATVCYCSTTAQGVATEMVEFDSLALALPAA
jgi:DNA-binding LacI/PurR family transcriptional regulator